MTEFITHMKFFGSSTYYVMVQNWVQKGPSIWTKKKQIDNREMPNLDTKYHLNRQNFTL